MDLLLTLGHNSSAIGIKNGKIIAGYEEERFTRNKSESKFPINSINKILTIYTPKKNEINNLFVSHWFDNFSFYIKYNKKINKYWDYKVINKLIKKYKFNLYNLNKNFTHHDAHAYSAICFLKNYKNIIEDKYFIIIADGFGNKQEVISIYEFSNIFNLNIKCINRYYGYEKSLGLIYQYATSYCNMKENRDEYKFLGYESHINKVLYNKKDKKILLNKINKFVFDFFILLENNNNNNNNNNNKFIDLNYLNFIKKKLFFYFDELVSLFSIIDNEYKKRIIIGYFIQCIIEKILFKFIKKYNMKNILLAGGLFYNVKLNNSILEKISGKISIMPLAGDQGAAIGIYEKYINHLNFKNLFWGKRNIKINKNYNIIHSKEEMIDKCSNLLLKNHIINIVIGSMEFGPRALCHSSTLCLPNSENVDIINNMNNRNTIMPMAPVILEENIKYFFYKKDYSKVIGSDNYMIITYNYKKFKKNYSGVMHNYPFSKFKYSGRPQIIRDKNSTIYKILKKINKKIKCLINTSFNIHGKPIVYNINNIQNDFDYQLKHISDKMKNKIHLFIGDYNE